jgi:hypothetical protein
LPILHEIINSKKLNQNTLSTSPNKKLSISSKLAYDPSHQEHDNINNDNMSYEYDTIQNFSVFKKNVNTFVNGKYWKTSNTESIGQLWLKLLTFYSIDFGFKKSFVSIRKEKRISKSKVKMYSKKLAVEDPFSLKQSLSRNLLTETNKFIITTISKCCLYFVTKTDNHLIINGNNNSCNHQNNDNLSIVDNLISETGIIEARKTNKQLDEENEDDEFDDSEDEAEENADENDAQEISDDDDDDDENDIIYNENFKLKKKIKVDELIKIKDMNLIDEPSSIETRSSLSIPIKQQNGCFDSHDDMVSYDDLEDDVILSASDDSTSDKNDILKADKIPNTVNYLVIRNKTRSRSYTADNLIDSKGVIKNCLDDLIDQIVDEYELIYDIIPNLNLEIYKETFVPSNDKSNKYLFKFTANSIGLSKVDQYFLIFLFQKTMIKN